MQYPIVSAMVDAVSTIYNVTMFVHNMEVEINWDDVYSKADALTAPALIELIAFTHNGKTINFMEFDFGDAGRIDKFDVVNMMIELVGRQPDILRNIKAFNHSYALAKIVALWRTRFPVPTLYPTCEEKQWCAQRLLSPAALREMEAEVISWLQKFERCNQGGSDVCYVDTGLTEMRYPATDAQLEQFFQEQKYDYAEHPKDHDKMWDEARR